MKRTTKVFLAAVIIVTIVTFCTSTAAAMSTNGSVDRSPLETAMVEFDSQEYVVLPRPADSSAGYVLPYQNTLTLSDIAVSQNTIGLLAHNYLAGKSFGDVKVGSKIDVTYKDGSVDTYLVQKVLMYRSYEPFAKPHGFIQVDSNFEDITGTLITASDLFRSVYSKDGLVLQTCVEHSGDSMWGRLFVVAAKYAAESRFE